MKKPFENNDVPKVREPFEIITKTETVFDVFTKTVEYIVGLN